MTRGNKKDTNGLATTRMTITTKMTIAMTIMTLNKTDDN